MKLFPTRFSALIISAVICTLAVFPSSASSVPQVSAKSAVLVEGDSGEIVWSKNSDERLPMASTTKIMTALVAVEHCSDLTKNIKIDRGACGIEGSSIYLKEGEELTLEQLLYALLLESANDSACAIAIEIAGSVEKFADLMNETAQKIGMNDSHFTNPHGLDHEDHFTTAEDMAKLTVYALKNTEFLRIVSTYKTTIPMNGDEGTRLLLNHNKMLKYYDGAIGVKTGFTKRSGRCLVSAAERNGVRMIAVTLSAPDDWNDHRAMLDYGFSLYTHVDFAEPGSVSVQMPVTGGTSEFITLSNKDHGHICLSVNSADIRCVIEAPRFVYAPINKDDIIGHACYYVGDKEITRLPLYADSECPAIDEPSLWKRITAFFK